MNLDWHSDETLKAHTLFRVANAVGRSSNEPRCAILCRVGGNSVNSVVNVGLPRDVEWQGKARSRSHLEEIRPWPGDGAAPESGRRRPGRLGRIRWDVHHVHRTKYLLMCSYSVFTLESYSVTTRPMRIAEVLNRRPLSVQDYCHNTEST
jgi:hypothetical protein